jgi:phospholipid/cholesterol/gamma-HCH transport system substrate-binding protein
MAKINQQGGIIDNLSESSEVLADTLPTIQKMSNSITQSAHSADRVLSQLEQNPQSLLFGRPSPQPGPGEEGFVSPLESTQ